jgi:hypothetical protein
MTRQSKLFRWSVFYALILAVAPPVSAQWNEQVLYSFQGGTDGATPVGNIVYDKQGNLYGATLTGGSSSCSGPGGCGTVYELSPPAKNGEPWTETQLHVFKGRTLGDGSQPEGGLVMDATGNLYGTTGYDGSGNCTLLGSVVGCGTVYEMSPPSQPGRAWTETVLYNFQGGNDGYIPTGDLVFDKAGNLYGVTLFGGGKGTNCGDSLYPNCGTVFELSPPNTNGGAWTETVLYSFVGNGAWSVEGDGSQPNGGLVFDVTGDIYGTTAYGGSTAGVCQRRAGCGTAFELMPPRQKGDPWTENVLHRFQGQPSDGVYPNGNLILSNGVLYGTAGDGGAYEQGVSFSLQPPAGGSDVWVEDLIHVFTDGTDGAGPSSLVLSPDGTFYGTAGGSPSRGGVIFQMQPPIQNGQTWDFAVDYDFTGSPNGYDPMALSLVNGGHEMFGGTLFGGTGTCQGGGCGTVFGVKP